MSLLLLVCNCSGSDGLVRGTLKETGLDDWLEPPLVKGKKMALQTLNQFPDYYKRLPQWGALYDSITNRSSFAVIVGYDQDHFQWADVAMGDIKSKLDGEVIATKFH